jgi:hypothetical protein
MTDHDVDSCLDCTPSPAELGDTLTVDPRVWTPLDDHGTQLYVYGDQQVEIAVQIAPVDDEIRQLRRAFDDIDRLLDQYRGAKALREGAQAIVDRVRGITGTTTSA